MAFGAEPMLTPRQGYLCMFEFLRQYNERGRTDEVDALLGSMQLLADGGPANPALVVDWGEAVAAVLKAEATGGYAAAALRLNKSD